MNIISRFNKFFGLAHHYTIFYAIYKSGKMANIGVAYWNVHKRSIITDYQLMKSGVIEDLSQNQKDLLESENSSLIITGISYLGYFKVKK